MILFFGAGSPVAAGIHDAGLRRILAGFLFGTLGAAIALSPIGKESGAHINPAVTFSFWLLGRLRTPIALSYVLAQTCGAVAGALPLLLWGATGKSVAYGATVPGDGFSGFQALLGESGTTFALVIGLFFFIRHRRLRACTPALFPFLYAVMVFLEGPVSGTSTNPARTFGPAVLSGAWADWWVYWLGPAVGAVAAVTFYNVSWLRALEIEVAKVYHFEHDPHGIFKHTGRSHGKDKS